MMKFVKPKKTQSNEKLDISGPSNVTQSPFKVAIEGGEFVITLKEPIARINIDDLVRSGAQLTNIYEECKLSESLENLQSGVSNYVHHKICSISPDNLSSTEGPSGVSPVRYIKFKVNDRDRWSVFDPIPISTPSSPVNEENEQAAKIRGYTSSNEVVNTQYFEHTRSKSVEPFPPIPPRKSHDSQPSIIGKVRAPSPPKRAPPVPRRDFGCQYESLGEIDFTSVQSVTIEPDQNMEKEDIQAMVKDMDDFFKDSMEQMIADKLKGFELRLEENTARIAKNETLNTIKGEMKKQRPSIQSMQNENNSMSDIYSNSLNYSSLLPEDPLPNEGWELLVKELQQKNVSNVDGGSDDEDSIVSHF